jgi:hypothetical protein
MSQDKRHPKSTFDAKYPYNRVEVTESGHEIHYDDTPGKERIRRSHKSGSYEEWSHDGKVVTMAVGNRVDYSKQGLTTTVDKNHDVKVGGSVRTSISGGSHSEIKGTSSTAVDGDSKTMVGGNMVSAVKGDSVSGVTGKTVMRLGGGIEVKGDAKMDGKFDSEASMEFGSTLDLSAKSDITIKSDTKITLIVGGSKIVIAPDHISIKSSGPIYLDGTQINAKSGANKATPDWVSGASPAPD